MTDRIEKAYYLKEKELEVLLSIKGVRELYGFRMDVNGAVDRKELHRVLFGMAKKNMLSLSDGQFRIDEGVEAVLEDMAGAGNVLILTGGPEYPECCIYAGQNLVLVRLLGRNGKIYRMESMDRREAGLKLREYGWMVPGLLDKTPVCQEEGEQHQQMRKLAGMLYGQEKESISRREEVRRCLMQYSAFQGKKIRQLLIISGVLEDYITVSDGQQDEVYLYSDKKAEELLGQLLGGGI